jgi:para-aminobenzoate synthetase component I
MTDLMNYYAENDIPFLFIIDFDIQAPVVIPMDQAAQHGIFYDIDGLTNYRRKDDNGRPIAIGKHPIAFERYKKAFDIVQRNLREGNSFLLNLTFPTPIDINFSLREIFERSSARYKLLFKDRFVVFSPESFVIVRDGMIYSFPMKGTIEADIPFALERLSADEKERAEHFTIVDLIRNDLSMVAHGVRVEAFRYFERIHTGGKDLLQTSSRISGKLGRDWQSRIGEIILQLLPAGSISGAPKRKTVQIIRQAEDYDRGYYTGVFGYYHRGYLESAVMIRFIEKTPQGSVFKSGGGITVYSDPEKEYQELIDKIYVPAGVVDHPVYDGENIRPL